MSEVAVESAPETGDDAEQLLAAAVEEPESEQEQQPDAMPDTGGKSADPDPQAEIAKWKSLARKHEQNAKANADAAKKYAEYEDSQKSEHQKLMERLEAAERERDALSRGHARMIAAATHGLSPELLERLGGNTEDEINEAAQTLAEGINAEVGRRLPDLVAAEVEKRLAELRGGQPSAVHAPARTRPVEALTPGAMPANSQPEDGNDFLRRMAGRP